MKTGKRKRLAALLLCLCMMVGMLPLSGTASAAELQDTQDNEQTQEETQQTAKTITAVAELEEDAARQTAPVGTERSGLSLPDKLTGTVDGKEGTSFPVTWECEAFDGNTPGEYTFTAILGEAYTMAENVTLPTVTVAVKAQKAPLMLRGAANSPTRYEISKDEDWTGLQAWLDNTAYGGAVVSIKTASSDAREIKVPNKNITIEGAVPVGTDGTLRLTSTEAVTLTIRNLEMSFEANGIDLATGSTLKFEGDNILTPTNIDSYSAAIHVLKDDTLTVTGVGASSSLTVTATNAGAGIGGMATDDNGEAAGTVNITGGKVTVKATHGAGIGGGAGITKGGAGGTVNISGASTVVDITMTGNGAGIGGGSSNATGGAGGNATITGGTVKINAMEGAGIGGGVGVNTVGGAGGMVKISGESTTVDITMSKDGFGAGIGGGGSNITGGAGAGVTIAGGKVTIKASYGAGIGGGNGRYKAGAGGRVSISDAYVTVESTYSYDIGAHTRGSNDDFGTLTIDSTGTNRTVLDMQNKGTNAVLDHSIGTCQIKDASKALTGYYSKLTVTDGTASSQDSQKDYWKPEIFKSGSTVTLTANKPQGKYFSKWTADPTLTFADAEAVSTTFTMPEVAQAVTANYEQEDAPVISGDTSKDVAFGYGAASTDAYTVTGGPEPTVTQDENYSGKITWNDTTKKLDIAEGLDVGKYPVVLTVSNGVKPDAALTFTLTVEGIAPVITAQPKGAGYTAGQAAAPLAVAAEAKDGGTLSYQWYKNTKDSTTDGTKIDGAIDTEYKPDTGEAGTLYYYCVVTSSYGGQVPSLSTVSGTAAVSVTIPSHEVIPGPEDGKPLNLTKDGVFAFEGEFTNVAAIRINGHTLKQTPVSGTQARLSGYPEYASELGDVKEGSVIVTLYKEFLRTLPDGTYTLEVEFLDGRETSVSGTKFEIRQGKPKPTHDSKGSVATGDVSLIWPWVLLMLAALAGGTLAIGRKRRVQ